MYVQRSEADGFPLPMAWHMSSRKSDVIAYLNGRDAKVPMFWLNMFAADKKRVIQHLVKVGSVSISALSFRDGGFVADKTCSYEFRDNGCYPGVEGLTYQKPNGGKRILPSVYGRLRDHWLRPTGQALKPDEMNDGHLENTLNLLKESHGNVGARAQDLLGRMAYHYQNDLRIVTMLADTCRMMQEVEVDDMYPIFAPLAAEMESRQIDRSASEGFMARPDDDLLRSW